MSRRYSLTPVRICLTATLLFATSSPNAADSTALPITQAAAKADYQKRLVCRKESVIGTLIKQTICLTQEQTDTLRKLSQETLRRQQEHVGQNMSLR